MVSLCRSMYPTGNVEDWLLEVEKLMKESVKKVIGDSLINYPMVQSYFLLHYFYFFLPLPCSLFFSFANFLPPPLLRHLFVFLCLFLARLHGPSGC